MGREYKFDYVTYITSFIHELEMIPIAVTATDEKIQPLYPYKVTINR
jgi:hypothetical protein